MNDIVGQEGEVANSSSNPPACAKQYDYRVMKTQVGPHGVNIRNQRELSTLSVVLDHLVLGRYKQAADVVAARLKSVDAANKEGGFASAQYLELLPVNAEGLVTAEEKLVLKHEMQAGKSSWNDSGQSWKASGKGAFQNYTWVPNSKAKDKGQGKDKSKGKKGKGKKDKEE